MLCTLDFFIRTLRLSRISSEHSPRTSIVFIVLTLSFISLWLILNHPALHKKKTSGTEGLFSLPACKLIFIFAGLEANPPHTPNTMMEKKSVDDLFRRLMQVGIIKVTPEPGNESPRHAPSPGPPQAEIQKPQPLPVLPVSLPGLTLPASVVPQKEPPKVKPIPVIKLVPEELKR